jgi:TolA-binding protein
MRTRTFTALALLLAFAGSPRMAGAQNREHQQMTAELRMLQEQTQQLAIAVAAIQQALASSVKALTTRLDAADDALRRGLADQKLALDAIGADVRVVRERADDTNVRIASLREEIEALRVTTQALQQAALAPPPAPVDPLAPVDPNAPAPTPVPAAPIALPATAGLSPTRLYDTARADYFAGQWTSAISGFEAFLRAFPRSEQADDAQLYIGETYFAQNQWAQAVTAYALVASMYPGTNSVPIAHYKRGLAEERLGRPDQARAAWEIAARDFPDSDAGRLARQNLDRLERAQPR